MTYVRVRWTLHSREPTEAVRRLRRHSRRHPVAGQEGGLLLGWRLAHAVNVTLRPLPTDVRCLFRSLTLMTMMERRNLHPKLIIAVRPDPFAAHAWIEFERQPLLPPGDPDHARLVEL